MFLEQVLVLKTVLGSTYKTEIFYFFVDLILGSFRAFSDPNGLFWEAGYSSKTVLESAHVLDQI